MKVLMVDDESIIRIGLKSIINWEAEGFSHVLEASSGQEAYDIALSEKPELIITDIKMPGWDGLELIRQLKKVRLKSIIVVLSSYNDFDLVRQAMVLGAADYLLKVQLSEDLLIETLNALHDKLAAITIADSSVFSRNLHYLQQKMIQDALMVGGEAEQILLDMRNTLRISLDFDDCFLAIIRYSYKDVMLNDTEQYRVFRNAMINTIEETLKDNFSCLCVEVDLNQLALLFQFSNPSAHPYAEFLPFGNLIHEMLHVYMNVEAEICFSPLKHCAWHLTWERLRACIHLNVLSHKHLSVIDTSALSLLPEPLDQSIPFYLDRFLSLHRLIDEQKSITNITEHIKALYNDTLCHGRNPHITLVLAFLSCFVSLLRKNPQYQAQLSYDPAEIKYYSDEDLKKCFTALTDALINLFNSATQYPYPIRKAITFIEQNYYSDINIKDVADHVELNPSYFGTLFKQHVGVSPVSYIISVRMNHAKKLLKETNFRVYEIAQMTGYENTYYFNRLFKKIVGLTPNEYRNSL